MDRIKTGIKGFDKLVEGGLPAGKSILMSGTPGTCKTIFALQFLHNGATMYDQNGLYISFEEKSEHLHNQAKQFGWEFDKLLPKVKVISMPAKNIKETTAQEIIKLAEEHKIQRLVIDSLSALSINTPCTFATATELTDITIKRFLYSFINDLRDIKQPVTSLLISQTSDHQLSRDGVSEFICDGIIHINFETLGGKYSRSLIVRKMRETKNDEDLHPLEIGNKGLVVHSFKE
jgi:circadian clock protein KaiC